MSTLTHWASLVLCGFTGIPPLWAQTYQITDLKALPGDSQSVACGVETAYGLNSLGQAAGMSSNPSAAIATLFSNGATTNLTTLGKLNVSVAISTNNASEVVAYKRANTLAKSG